MVLVTLRVVDVREHREGREATDLDPQENLKFREQVTELPEVRLVGVKLWCRGLLAVVGDVVDLGLPHPSLELRELLLQSSDVLLLDEPAAALSGLVLLLGDGPEELPGDSGRRVQLLRELRDGDLCHFFFSLC